MTREEKMRVWWERYRIVLSHDETKGWFTENSKKSTAIKHFMWSYLWPGGSPLTLHQAMATDSMKAFGTDK